MVKATLIGQTRMSEDRLYEVAKQWMQDRIIIKGARLHNLKNTTLSILKFIVDGRWTIGEDFVWDALQFRVDFYKNRIGAYGHNAVLASLSGVG